MPSRADCYIEDPPEPPPTVDISFSDDEGIMSRTMVHVRDWNLLQQWASDMQTWANEIRGCVYQIMEKEP